MSPFIMNEARILVRPSGTGKSAPEPVVLATVRFENYSNSAYKGAAPGCFRSFPVDVNVMPFKTGTPITKARYVLEKLGINVEYELERIRSYLGNIQSGKRSPETVMKHPERRRAVSLSFLPK